MLNPQFNRLLPYRSYDEHEIINLFAMDQTGIGGKICAFLTGGQDPATSAGAYSNTNPGYTPAGITNPRYEVTRKVTSVIPIGATKHQIVGINLQATLEYDENGQKILFNPWRKVELNAVVSGEAVQILTKGMIRLGSGAYIGTPLPGYVGVATGDGQVLVVDPATISYTGGPGIGPDRVIGKFFSSSGSAFGGYADFKLDI